MARMKLRPSPQQPRQAPQPKTPDPRLAHCAQDFDDEEKKKLLQSCSDQFNAEMKAISQKSPDSVSKVLPDHHPSPHTITHHTPSPTTHRSSRTSTTDDTLTAPHHHLQMASTVKELNQAIQAMPGAKDAETVEMAAAQPTKPPDMYAFNHHTNQIKPKPTMIDTNPI